MRDAIESMAVSKFKATCLSVLQRVKCTGRPVMVTRFGEPVAEIVPPRPAERERRWLGALAGRGRIVGDVVGPVVGDDEWEAARQ
jgi:antitoxin (DNA-binding transcriptional repressor) of toxin-antitoxin stability system